ncbi:MAG: hypothetical protein J6A95_00840 [Clostridia bacterium]|nr:hypothetical protein [Clostridia bacterium]
MKAKLYIKDYESKEAEDNYVLKGEVALPITTEELLDEELDRAFVVLNNDTTELYPPNTEVKIVIEQGEETKEFYYIVGDDDSTEISVN